ncbi:ABC transporter substrate-binding protein [Paenibacillus chitinolyticus]|uniref:hypothetical protein n=1 Tax=Paenibacillus chitinolyticus TaxID=79263 RepID=UPI002DBBC6C8|nr:hypothetical protein [Paenibacillus chitinolyticus]MEC0245607.1 ABC transporter substrate-binding protein [Paenibacillus chitinolyticus]
MKPDLIIVSSEDESQYDTLRSIAPTLTFDSFAPPDERIELLGTILGRRREADHSRSWRRSPRPQAGRKLKNLAIAMDRQVLFRTGPCHASGASSYGRHSGTPVRGSATMSA